MRFDKKVSFKRLFIISVISLLLLGLVGILYLKYALKELIISPRQVYCGQCHFPASVFICGREFTFDAEIDSFGFALKRMSLEKEPIVIEQLSLIQELPTEKVNCWLNISNLPGDKQHEGRPGLLIGGQEIVDVKLSCVDFSLRDVKKGVWRFDAKTYWPESGFSPQEPIQGFVRINYYECGPNKSEWCAYSFLEKHILRRCG